MNEFAVYALLSVYDFTFVRSRPDAARRRTTPRYYVAYVRCFALIHTAADAATLRRTFTLLYEA